MRKLILSGVLSLGLIFVGCTSTNTSDKVENEPKQEVVITNDNFDYEAYKKDLTTVLEDTMRYMFDISVVNSDHLDVSDERLKSYKKDYDKHSKELKRIQDKYKNVAVEEIKEEKEYFDLYVKYFDLKTTKYLNLIETKTDLDKEYYDLTEEFIYFSEKVQGELGIEI